jgi:hypothetical protein
LNSTNAVHQKPSTFEMKIAVGIATAGRPWILATAIRILAQQTRLPDRLVICPASAEDYEAPLAPSCLPTLVVFGAKGSSAQRNLILSAVSDMDVVVFFDDDFFPTEDYLEQVEYLFSTHSDVVAATGRPIEDGANGPGLSVDHGLSVISRAPKIQSATPRSAETQGTYGCNMSFRLAPVCEQGFLFDENLPLYGWQEDIDFSSRLAPYGRIVESGSLRGVHLGAKMGRTSGLRFGYSQIANPIYLVRKGTMPRAFALKLMLKNIAANLLGSFRPEPWIDRRGRLRGNFLALVDVTIGRISPQRILQLK